MIKLVAGLISRIVSLMISGAVATYGVSEVYTFIQKEAVRKISQGLTPISKLSNQLTCMKFTESGKFVRHFEGSCAKNWKSRRK